MMWTQPAMFLTTLWRRMIQPAMNIKNKQRLRQMRLLAALLLLFLALILFGFILPNCLWPLVPPMRNPDLLVAVLAGIVIGAAYGLNRAGHYEIAARLAVIGFSFAIFASTMAGLAGLHPQYAAQDSIGLLSYLIIPVFVSRMFLTLRFTLKIIVVYAGAMFLLPVIFTHLAFMQIVNDPLLFLFALSVFVLLAAHHRDEMEKERLQELAASENRYRTLAE
ncbi:hypothetical protein GF373_09455, partial [bacterium]|nr:hypothetical protein [bacterium]